MKNIATLFCLLICTISFGQIAMNQVGFYPKAPKQAIVENVIGITGFSIVTGDKGKVVYRGKLGEPKQSKNSSLTTRMADFSSFETSGTYRLVAGSYESAPFIIAVNVHEPVAKALLKSYYYTRASMPLYEQYAGKWSRPAGHPDTAVLIHPSAATGQRPSGTVIRSPGGWYDAGDYNKYIVNCGITMGTLLSAYEDFPQYFARLGLNIPESGNGVPDILNETAYNLRWMLTMQDPGDGGVYHKCTNASFDGMVMPGVTKAPRYVVQKGTAATLGFVAVMAQSVRVYKAFSSVYPGLADSCLLAAWKAWQWAQHNPSVEYNQDGMNKRYQPAITTGAYGDRRFGDEWFWAASEMYVTTSEPVYKTVVSEYTIDRPSLPSWGDVYMLGVYTLLRKDTKNMANQLRPVVIQMADRYLENISGNAFGVVMGEQRSDFVWGSNGVAANQGILLIQAYLLTKDKKYLGAALTNVDYLLGRNATGYCFVTGFGARQVMHPHHRPSEADGIADPVPGLLAGGPNPGMQDKCQYEYTDPERTYTDNVCSYASNETAINWNAAAVYLLNAIEALE